MQHIITSFLLTQRHIEEQLYNYNLSLYSTSLGIQVLRALGELSYANHCVQLRTFDSCYIWSTDLKKVGALFFGGVVRPKNAPEGLKIGCLGGFFK